ncbi:hypothetical protein VDG1235_1228 [Verrucomicrobiia bacterium DG1235]|nr:hypothetical protein VDG1235_1228 [Verrucomicrobiae bacterium DG1235]
MHASLLSTSHRPWPLPPSQWKWRQSWLDLAFIHYRASSREIRSLLPEGVNLQKYDGSAWIGLVPFRMSGVMRRPMPDIPLLSSFPELNLRTYVEVDGEAGVWFFSLDAASLPMVFGGRLLYGLPYYYSKMSHRRQDDWIDFSSSRKRSQVEFSARYRPVGDTFQSPAGTFEHWATERYCLYTTSAKGALERIEVHHQPWPIQKAEVEIERCDLFQSAGITLEDQLPVCHFSSGVNVVSFRKEETSQALDAIPAGQTSASALAKTS